MRCVRSTRIRLFFVASIALTSLSLGVTGASAGFVGTVGTCDIEYSPQYIIVAGDQDRFAPVATYRATSSGWIAPAAIWQWLSRDNGPWVALSGGGTPTNTPSSTPVSRFDLEDTLEFFLGVSLPLEDRTSYRINVAYTSMNETPAQNAQAVLCSTSITIRYYDTMPEFEIDEPDYLMRAQSAVTALPNTL
jgi:hypothetical protein